MLKSSQITKVRRRRPKSTDERIVLKSNTESKMLKSVDKCKIPKSEKIGIFCSIIGARRVENGIHYETS